MLMPKQKEILIDALVAQRDTYRARIGELEAMAFEKDYMDYSNFDYDGVKKDIILLNESISIVNTLLTMIVEGSLT